MEFDIPGTGRDHDGQRVVIVHGYGATPASHWFHWFDRAVTNDDVEVRIPAMPDTDNPDALEWRDAMHVAIGEPDEGLFLVGHSLGCVTVLNALATLPGDWTIGGLLLIAPFIAPVPRFPELDEFLALDADMDIEGLARRIPHRFVVRSDDDPLIPPHRSDELAERLGVEPIVVRGGGHFLDRGGYTAFPLVLELLREAGLRA